MLLTRSAFDEGLLMICLEKLVAMYLTVAIAINGSFRVGRGEQHFKDPSRISYWPPNIDDC